MLKQVEIDASKIKRVKTRRSIMSEIEKLYRSRNHQRYEVNPKSESDK